MAGEREKSIKCMCLTVLESIVLHFSAEYMLSLMFKETSTT